jgi:hypothetical protein
MQVSPMFFETLSKERMTSFTKPPSGVVCGHGRSVGR